MRLYGNSELFRTDLEQLGHVFFPGADLQVVVDSPAGAELAVTARPEAAGMEAAGMEAADTGLPAAWTVTVRAGARELSERVVLPPGLAPRAYEHRIRRAAKGLAVDLLSACTGFRPGWGHLTGVRPTRLVHEWLDRGASLAEARAALVAEYRLTEAKAALVTEIAALQRPFLRRDPLAVSIYIGIPYCPTICSFCSFSIYPLVEHREQVPDFLGALHRELAVVGAAIQELGLRVESLYLGGGTPTSPPDADFAALLAQIAATVLKGQAPREYTVEAGRPETITRHKLDAMAAHGVTRISVNPQTTVQETLRHLGRIHTVAAFHMAYERVRQHPHPFVVNSDIIVGLPGEGVAEVRQTLADMERLAPDNLTVHTLAIKRGSRLHAEGAGAAALTRLTREEAEAMLAEAAATAARMGQRPYYLYRQKYMVGNMENVGYSLPGLESVYNITMLNHAVTTIGLGHAGTTHLVPPAGPAGFHFQGPANPEDPATYIRRAEELAHRKAAMLRLVHGEAASAQCRRSSTTYW